VELSNPAQLQQISSGQVNQISNRRITPRPKAITLYAKKPVKPGFYVLGSGSTAIELFNLYLHKDIAPSGLGNTMRQL
jgi:hypothetical protein